MVLWPVVKMQRKELIRFISSATIVVLAVAGLFEVLLKRAPVSSPPETTQPYNSPTPSVTPSLAVSGRGDDAVVARVVDGDTVVLADGRIVRYIGIDAPETKHPRKQTECFGHASSEANRRLVEGKSVRLERDVSETDRYGRLLRYVWLGGTLVNEQLVRQGYAAAAPFPPDVRYRDLLRSAQRDARRERKGLWGEEC